MYYLPKFGKIVWNDANAVTQKLKYADVKVVKAEKERKGIPASNVLYWTVKTSLHSHFICCWWLLLCQIEVVCYIVCNIVHSMIMVILVINQTLKMENNLCHKLMKKISHYINYNLMSPMIASEFDLNMNTKCALKTN